jgi:UDP-N-acetyl-D-glucosamine dehydrogenase
MDLLLDVGMGVWSYQTLMGFEDDIFKITPLAIDINVKEQEG